MPRLQIDYKLQDKFDFSLWLSAVLLICIGLAAIYSSTLNNAAASSNFEKQVIWAFVSIIVFFVAYSLPVNSFKMVSIPSYLLSLLLLAAVVVIGRRVYGAKSWLDLGAFGFQPSEFAKIGTILALAAFLSRRNTNIESFSDIIMALVIGFIPVILILLEPDMGTALVFIGLILTMIFWKGISLFGLFVVLSPGFVALSSLFGTYYLFGALVIVLVSLFFFKKDIFFSGSILALNIGAGFFAGYVYKALSPHQQRRIQIFCKSFCGSPWSRV